MNRPAISTILGSDDDLIDDLIEIGVDGPAESVVAAFEVARHHPIKLT